MYEKFLWRRLIFFRLFDVNFLKTFKQPYKIYRQFAESSFREKKNNHRNSYFQHRKFDKKSSTFCVKNLSIEYLFFFKWVWKVTKIRQLIFHRIWKNMYQYILFSRSPYGWFSKYDRKEFNTLHSVYEWGHQRWNLWKEKSRFIYLLVLKHNRPHYWTKNV